jgi:hypothetical protein
MRACDFVRALVPNRALMGPMLTHGEGLLPVKECMAFSQRGLIVSSSSRGTDRCLAYAEHRSNTNKTNYTNASIRHGNSD